MTTSRSSLNVALLLVLLCTAGAKAGEADVVDVNTALTGVNSFRFDVTIAHADTGWEHYANAFEVLDLEGNILGVRKLAHPHVSEQPFTRSLVGVEISDDIFTVVVRAVDSVHGTGGIEVEVQLEKEAQKPQS